MDAYTTAQNFVDEWFDNDENLESIDGLDDQTIAVHVLTDYLRSKDATL